MTAWLARSRPVRRAAFFDLDGTLVPPPSLELRFVRSLRRSGALGAEHCLRWLCEAVRLAPSGPFAMRHSNKMYLHGLAAAESSALGFGDEILSPSFFPSALDCIQWHAEQGHRIAIVSGTLEPLAEHAARALEAQLAARGCAPTVRVCATRLQASNGRWTGRVLGEPVAGQAKARAVVRLAQVEGLTLDQCYAYADSASDRWFLGVVGHPFAVNPSWRLSRIARSNSWPILQWRGKREPRGLDDTTNSQFKGQKERQLASQESGV